MDDLLGMVPEGRIRVPQVQRGWPWAPEDVEELFDSLYRGYPVGTLLLWKRRGEEATLRLGPHVFTVPQRDEALWVVDGQQRITALVGVLMGSQDVELSPEFNLYFDLKAQTFVRPTRRRPPEQDWIPMRVVVDAEDLFAWMDGYRRHDPPKERLQLAFQLGKVIREYEIPACVMDTDDEKVLRHAFKRMNTPGKPLVEAEVFDALYRSPGQRPPRELREVAARLRETGFGDFETKWLLSALRSLLGQDAATDDDMRLPDGTAPEETLARTDRALRRVIMFFREDARIPHLWLLPYEMTVIPLAVFFDRYPDPSPRSRLLLARWVWRGAITGAHGGGTITGAHHGDTITGAHGGGTVSLQSTLTAARSPNESSAVDTLLKALPEHPTGEPGLSRFDGRHARSKLETLALLALEPKDFTTGSPVRLTELFDQARREILPTLINVPDGAGADLNMRAMTIANRIVHPPLQSRALRVLLRDEIEEDILKSHGISRAAWRALQGGDKLGFLAARGDRLAEHIGRFLEARAAWRQSDRPPLRSLVISDD